MENVKTFSNIGLASSRAGKTGSFHAWTLARSFDILHHGGAGRIERIELEKLIESQRSKRTRRRWIAEAVELGIFIPYDTLDYYRYVAPDRVAAAYNEFLPEESQCKTIQAPILVDIDNFLTSQWLGELYAGILEQRNNDKPIARDTIKDLHGIDKVSQWEYEQETKKIKVIENYVPLEKVTDKVKSIKKIKAMPDRRGIKIKHGRVVKQLPNVYVTNGVKVCKKGSSGIYRKRLQKTLYNNAQRVREKVKLYYQNAKTASKASRRHAQAKYYHQKHDSRGFNWWGEVLPY